MFNILTYPTLSCPLLFQPVVSPMHTLPIYFTICSRPTPSLKSKPTDMEFFLFNIDPTPTSSFVHNWKCLFALDCINRKLCFKPQLKSEGINASSREGHNIRGRNLVYWEILSRFTHIPREPLWLQFQQKHIG